MKNKSRKKEKVNLQDDYTYKSLFRRFAQIFEYYLFIPEIY